MKVVKFTGLAVSLLLVLGGNSCNSNRQTKVTPPTPPPPPPPAVQVQAPTPVKEVPQTPPVSPPPVVVPPPDPAVLQKKENDILETTERRFQEGKAKLQAKDVAGAKASFDSAVDLILTSGVDLRSNPRLKTLFDELFNQLYQLETVTVAEAKEEEPGREKGKESLPEQKYEPAVADVLENVNVYPISIEAGLQHLVEEDIVNTKYDIPVHINENVLRWLEYFKGRGRNIMELGLRRIGLYRDMIHRIFQEAGVPKDLIYIAQQESVFKPLALSRARAKGMWQFLYSTGKRYGLDQSWWIDEKLDPEKSTRAAAQHLLKLYDMFKDWYLVMAAYNAGEFGIQRITEKTGIRDFWQLADRKLLYRQTVDYVPSILATMIIAKHPEKYGFDVEPLLPIQSKKVRIPSPVDLSVVAGTVGLTLDEIRDLNPELRHLVTPANQKFYDINLPLDKSEEAVKTLAVMPEEKRVRWQRYEIQEGDSLWAISRHFRVSIEMIMDANNMTSTKLRVGRYLLIPPYPVPRTTSQAEAAKTAPKGSGGAATGPQMASKAPSAAVSKGAIQLSVSSNSGGNGNGSGKKDPKALATPTTSPSAPATVLAKPASGRAAGLLPVQAFSPAAAEPKSADKKIIHTIQRGDTLYDIARRYKTTANQLRQWNGLSGNLLRPGDTLLIFVPR